MTHDDTRSQMAPSAQPIRASEIIEHNACRDNIHAALEQVERGLYQFRTGRRARALALFRQASLIAPHSAIAHYIYGISLKSAGRDADAVAEWQAATRTNSEDSDECWARERARNLLLVFRDRQRRHEMERADAEAASAGALK